MLFLTLNYDVHKYYFTLTTLPEYMSNSVYGGSYGLDMSHGSRFGSLQLCTLLQPGGMIWPLDYK